jgi:hypothetical protein
MHVYSDANDKWNDYKAPLRAPWNTMRSSTEYIVFVKSESFRTRLYEKLVVFYDYRGRQV